MISPQNCFLMQVFHAEEAVAKEAANKVMKRFAERMSKAEAESKVTMVMENV